MAKTVSEFSKEVIRICYESKIVNNWKVTLHEDVVARIRIFLVDNSFIGHPEKHIKSSEIGFRKFLADVKKRIKNRDK